MKAIWKYHLELTDIQTVELPVASKILSVGNQRGIICLWVEVISSPAAKEKRCIRIVGTGHEVYESPGRFIGTVIIEPLVWHVFDATF